MTKTNGIDRYAIPARSGTTNLRELDNGVTALTALPRGKPSYTGSTIRSPRCLYSFTVGITGISRQMDRNLGNRLEVAT